MVCVSTIIFPVLINNLPFGLISPQRGNRQGVSFSPFLFVLCTDGLSHRLNLAERDGNLCGFRFSEQGLMVHHLWFVDDNLSMYYAEEGNARTLHNILSVLWGCGRID